jgi:hypothetical protein
MFGHAPRHQSIAAPPTRRIMATGFKFLSPQQVAQAEAWRIELTGPPDGTPSADSFTEEGANFEDEFAEVGEANFQKDSDEDGTLIDLTTLLRICTM